MLFANPMLPQTNFNINTNLIKKETGGTEIKKPELSFLFDLKKVVKLYHDLI